MVKAIQKSGSADNPYAVATAQWKKSHGGKPPKHRRDDDYALGIQYPGESVTEGRWARAKILKEPGRDGEWYIKYGDTEKDEKGTFKNAGEAEYYAKHTLGIANIEVIYPGERLKRAVAAGQRELAE